MNISGVNKSSALAIAAFLLVFSDAALAQTNTGFSYDELGRLETVTYNNGTTVTYVYDAAGNRTAKVAATSGSSFTQTIQVTSPGPVNLRTLATSAGYVGGQNANITFEVGNGVTIVGDPGSGVALDTGTWPTGFTITLALVVKSGGSIYGGGGNGGAGGAISSEPPTSGATGGDAIYVRVPISITVQSGGVIGGGGNGGDGGAGIDWSDPSTGDHYLGGGGGGGGFPNGAGGPGGVTTNPNYSGPAGNPGADGVFGGAGGAGQSDGSYASQSGGNGGGAGLSGYAIRKNGNTVSLSNSGTVLGTVN